MVNMYTHNGCPAMERTSCVFVSEKMEVLGMGKETAFTEAGVNYGEMFQPQRVIKKLLMCRR